MGDTVMEGPQTFHSDDVFDRFKEYVDENLIRDANLPLQERPRCLTSAPDADDFWAAFDKDQWMFCPVSIGPKVKLHNTRLQPRQILPLQIVRELSKSGRPAKVQLAKLQPSAETYPPESVSHMRISSDRFVLRRC